MENGIKLSEANKNYLCRLKNNPGPAQKPLAQPKEADKSKNLTKALVCLGVLGATAAIGSVIYRGQFSKLENIEFDKGFAKIKGQTGGFSGTVKDKLKNGDKITLTFKDGVIQSSTRKGKVNFAKTYEISNGEKIVKTTVNGVTEEKNITQLAKNALKTKVFSVEDLKNGKIRVIFQKGKKQSAPVELPKYLYHITSGTSMEKISQSDMLKTSQNEQLPGLYLLDSENFLSHYGKTPVFGKNKDLISGIFKQASKSDKGMALNDREFVIIKIPTEDLLRTGKIRIRTQEDFFFFQGKIDHINKTLKTKYSLRGLCDDKIRTKFREDVISNAIMSEKEADTFIKEMTEKIHHGYGLRSASSLSGANSVEYIFSQNVQLSAFPNIQTRKVKAKDYILPRPNGLQCDMTKVSEIFDPQFFAPHKKN